MGERGRVERERIERGKGTVKEEQNTINKTGFKSAMSACH